MRYITLDEIKRQVSVDTNIDDTLLGQLGDAAEQATENHIHQPLSNTLGVDGDLPVALRQAILMMVCTLYENRESMSTYQYHYSPAYECLIGPYLKF